MRPLFLTNQEFTCSIGLGDYPQLKGGWQKGGILFFRFGGKLHVIFVFVQISLLRYFVCEVFIRDFMGHQELIEMVVVMNFASTGKQFFPKKQQIYNFNFSF